MVLLSLCFMQKKIPLDIFLRKYSVRANASVVFLISSADTAFYGFLIHSRQDSALISEMLDLNEYGTTKTFSFEKMEI